MTVAEMKISNRERLDKLEALDPEKLNEILDEVFSKYYPASKNEGWNNSSNNQKGWADEFFGIWNDMPAETVNEILSSRTTK